MSILGIGEIVLDKNYILDSFLQEGIKTLPTQTHASVGGPVPSALAFLSNMGHRTLIITALAKDTSGRFIKKQLSNFDIKTNICTIEATSENIILINTKNGTRTIIRHNNQNNRIKDFNTNLLKNKKLILFDRHESDAFDFVIKNKNKESLVMVDPSSEFSDKTIKMLKNSDVPIVPIEFIDKSSITENLLDKLTKTYKLLSKTFIVTAGNLGAIIYDGKKIEIVSAFDIIAVDANGAGDIFRGAFGYGLINNWNLKKCTEFANLISALQCTKTGNLSAIPTKEEISKAKAFLKPKNISIADFESILVKQKVIL